MTEGLRFGPAGVTLAAHRARVPWRLLVALSIAGCGATATATREPEARGAATETGPSDSAGSVACAEARAAILAAMAASRDASTCTAPSDCAVVTGPGHPDPEEAEVVAAADATALDALAEAHLARCGAFHHHEAIGAFRVVEAACVEGRCAAAETTFHVEE